MKITGIGALEWVRTSLCGMEYVNLKNNTIKILGFHFSYNRSLANDENYRRYIIKTEKNIEIVENSIAKY